MTQITMRAAATTLLMAAATIASAQSPNYSNGAPAPFRPDGAVAPSYNSNNAGGETMLVPMRDRNAQLAAQMVSQPSGAVAVPAQTPVFAQVAPGYPYLNAPLYACPRQDIPYQVGGTVITNQALSPHEMLYAHEYKAMYPPFYYRATGGWFTLPWGVYSHENWKLQGTVVKVKYHSHYSLFSGFKPPVVR